MASNFPSSLDSFTNPSSSDAMDSVSVPHATQHSDLNDAVEALQAKVGADSSAVTSSHDYKIADHASRLTTLEGATGSGLVVVKAETAFSAVSSVTADGVFTSDYTNYLVSVKYSTSSTQPCYYRLRASGVSTSANYNGQRIVISGTSSTPVRLTAQTAEFLGFTTSSSAYIGGSQLVLYGPQLAAKTPFFNNNSQNESVGPITGIISGDQSDATAFDGIELLVGTGTFTGSYTIYGYAQ